MAHKVTVYSTPSCPFCHMAKGYFRQNGVEFTDIDVSTNHAAAEEMVRKSGQMGVPVIDIDGNIVIGYQPALFQSFLQ